ncbi:S24 family peptidase [Gemmobacter caeni]|nr:S24 family peptidase [Gemmobacter caeni]
MELGFGSEISDQPVPSVTVDGDEYAHIPLHDALLAAGAGACNGTEEVIDHLAFRRDWLQRIGVSATTARLARVQGDSMQPSLWAGDMILIDTRADDPPVRGRDPRDQRRSPIYALIDNGEARVKRIERPTPDLMMLLSDNPDYAPELRHGDDMKSVQVIGKVVWWGHTNRD